MNQAQRPILVYDGDCGFCTRSVRVAEQLGSSAYSVPWQFTDLGAAGITSTRAQHEVLWVTPEGRVYGGARAVGQLLVDLGGTWRLLGLASRVPPLNWVAHALYRVVANNRHRLPGGTAACAALAGPPDLADVWGRSDQLAHRPGAAKPTPAGPAGIGPVL